MTDQLQPGPWLTIHKELGVEPPEFDDRPPGEFVELYAETIPENGALRYLEREICYRELNEMSNRLANALVTLGIGQNDVVGLHLSNIPQYGIALVALSKLGAVACGVSPLLAPAEVAGQMKDANVKVLISLDALAKFTLEPLDIHGRLPECLTAVIVTGADDLKQHSDLALPVLESVVCHAYLELTAGSHSEFRQRDLPPEHICLIVYTGGTTGKPKGAMLTLRGIMYNTLAAHSFRPWEVGRETAFNALPPTHIGGGATFIWAFRYGAG